MSWTNFSAEAEQLRHPDTRVIFPNALDRSKLDYTLDSLSVVDDYLRVIHEANSKKKVLGIFPAKKRGEPNPAIFNDALFVPSMRMVGAYVGEVMRREDQGLNWLTFAELESQNPSAAGFVAAADPLVREMNLCGPGDSVCWPGNKAVKFVMNGDEDSTRYFAIAMLRNQDKKSVQS